MGILTRLFRLCKADAHGVMDQLEDKDLLLKQYLREMEASLEEKESRLAKIVRHCRRMESDLSKGGEEIQKLEKDLELAVRKEKDDIARMLIRKRRNLHGGCEQLSSQLEHMTEEQNNLSETLSRQKLEFEQLKLKTAAFCQEARETGFDHASVPGKDLSGWRAPTDEEIELELLQHKEALRKGGDT